MRYYKKLLINLNLYPRGRGDLLLQGEGELMPPLLLGED